MTLDIATLEDITISLNPEHGIVKKYLESGNWKKAGIRPQIGKHAVFETLQYHMTCCNFEANSEHEIVQKYLEYKSWKKIGVHQHEGKRSIQKVLRFHMIHCLRVMQEPSNQNVLWKCPVCKIEMMLTPTQAKKRKYCSFECFKSIPRKRKPTSERRTFRMSPEWRNLRKRRISDFGNICPITLKKDRIDVHHIDSDWSNNDPDNLIPLQRELHRLVTARANYDDFLEARDRAIFSSITRVWKQ